MRKQRVTFSDVANETGFSKQTISRYFSRPETITPANREIIETALEKLGYQENKVARILAQGRTEFIGVIVPDLSLQFYSELLEHLFALFGKYGYKFLVFTGYNQPETERRYLSELLAYKIEGLIMLSHTLHSSELAKLPVPVVAIEREDEHIASISSDNFTGGQHAAQMLEESGCEVFIHINSMVTPTTPAYGRIIGFREYCTAKKLPCDVRQIDWASEFVDNQRIMQGLLDDIESKYSGHRKGIFVSNDNNAACLLNLIFRKYHCLPDDFRLVGFDASAASAEAIIPISTIGQRLDSIAESAVELLLLQMEAANKEEPRLPLEHRIIPVDAIARDTTPAISQDA